MVILTAILLQPVVCLAEDTGLGFRFIPGASFPLGADGEFFSVGAQAQIQSTFSPGALPWLLASVGIGYGFTPLTIDTSLSLISAGGAVGFQYPLGDQARVEAGGGGGFYYGLLNDGRDPRSGGGFVTGGVGFSFDLTPALSLGIAAEYRNYLALGQFVTVGLSGAVRVLRTAQPAVTQPTITAPRPLSEAAEADYLRIHDASFEEVFPVFFKYYNNHPIGTAQITNSGAEEISDITMNVFVGQYMDTPTACIVPESLAPGESATVEIRGFFNDRVVTIEESTLVSAELTVGFAHGADEFQRIYTQTIRLHDRNSMTWDDLQKPAAYVTPKDTAVLSFSRQVSGIVRDTRHGAVHPSLRTAIALHTALALYGTAYTLDPSSPYRRLGTELAIDYLQFPRQTLSFKAGDCDDLSILYCALLESLNIPTAMVLVPGHIFIAFNLQMPIAEARSQFARAEDLIFYEDETWIPLEVTSISDGFLSAWQTGAREWREAVARDQETFIVTADAWATYEPVGLPSVEQSITLPARDAIEAAYTEQVTDYIDQTIYPLVARIQSQLAERGRQPQLVNRLAVLYARYGLNDRARRELESLLLDNPDYAPALANLGNINFQEGDVEQAALRFEEALELAPDDPAILLGVARANHELENYGTASRTFNRVKELDPSLAERFAYLDLRGDDATRAAEIGGMREEMLWVEEDE